ncbi:MAG: HAD-IA family hydrolase [Aestuariivirgaceae bacterium]
MKLSTVVFDLDGTLVDTAPDLMHATNAILTAHGRRTVNLAEVRDMVGHGARRLIDKGFRLTGDPIEDDQLERLFRDFVDHYAANIMIDSRPYPGVIELMDACRAQGLTMAVCTNKLEALSVRLIEELELSHYFASIIGPDTIGIAKPDPAPLHAAVERAGGTIDRAIMVGDSETDIRTAKAAQVPAIGVSFGYTDRHVSTFEPEHVIDHYDEAWAILEGHYDVPLVRI